MEYRIFFVLLTFTSIHAQDSCPVNCAECTDLPPQCVSCPQQYALSSDASRCVKCPSFCMKCVSFNGNVVCLECQEGYTTNPSNGFCRRCPSNCVHCHFDFAYDNFRCDVCQERWALEDGECEFFRNHHYKDVISGERKNCPQDTKCEDQGLTTPRITFCHGEIIQNRTDPTSYFCDTSKFRKSAVNCVDGYMSVGNEDDVPCKKCPFYDEDTKRAYYVNEARKCESCPTYALGCFMLNSTVHITKCQGRYEIYHETFQSNRVCLECPTECRECKKNDKLPTKNSAKCKKCTSGYYLNDDECVLCENFCSACLSFQYCTSCMSGYVLNNVTGRCEACPPNCADCVLTSKKEKICTDCMAGYSFLEDGDCVACPPGCNECRIDCWDWDEEEDCKNYTMECMKPRCPDSCATCHMSDDDVMNGDGVKKQVLCDECIDDGRILTDAGVCECGLGTVYYQGACRLCRDLIPSCVECGKYYQEQRELFSCNLCAEGSVLKNNVTRPNPECVQSSVRSKDHCAGAPITDPPPRCLLGQCVNGSSITANYRCAIMCYQCSKDEVSCENPKITTCVTGQCYTQKKAKGNSSVVAAGCVDETIYCSAGNNTECCQTKLCNDVYSGNANVRLNGCLLLFTVLIGFISFI